MNFIVRFDV